MEWKDDILKEFARECNLDEEFVFTNYRVVEYGSGEVGVEQKKNMEEGE